VSADKIRETPSVRETIRGAFKASTQGTWKVENEEVVAEREYDEDMFVARVRFDDGDADAYFIAAAHEAVPALLADLEGLEKAHQEDLDNLRQLREEVALLVKERDVARKRLAGYAQAFAKIAEEMKLT